MQAHSSSYKLPETASAWLRDAITYWLDSLTIAKYSIFIFSRYRSWLLNLMIGPFLMIAPFVFLGDTLVGEGKPLTGSYFTGTEFTDYIGFLVVPLIAVNLSNTVFTWIGGLIRQEQLMGTFERALVTTQFTSTMFIGKTIAHLLYLAIFAVSTVALVFLWVSPEFDVNLTAAVIVIILHVLCVYGMAFAMSSLLIRVTDSWTVQTVMTRAVLSILAGATFPIVIFPGWLQAIAKAIPFTWIFELERQTLLQGNGIDAELGGFIYVVLATIFMWIFGFVMLRVELANAKRRGSLGNF